MEERPVQMGEFSAAENIIHYDMTYEILMRSAASNGCTTLQKVHDIGFDSWILSVILNGYLIPNQLMAYRMCNVYL